MSIGKLKVIELLQTTIELIQNDRLRVAELEGKSIEEILDMAEAKAAEAVEKAGELKDSKPREPFPAII